MGQNVLRDGSSVPVLFGSLRRQHLLLEAHRDGSAIIEQRDLTFAGTGLVAGRLTSVSRARIILDPRHPDADLVRATLRWLAGIDGQPADQEPDGPWGGIGPRPLGHRESGAFRILLALARHSELTVDDLASVLPDVWRVSIREAIPRFVRDGVATVEGDQVLWQPALPDCYRRLVLNLGDRLAASDNRFVRLEPAGARTWAFNDAVDGAPRIFGTDLRLRTLMALAKYGPMHLYDLRNLVGGERMLKEGRDNAPFTRSNVVVQWETPQGSAIALHPEGPIHALLRRFLVEMERQYPLPPFQRVYDEVEVPAEPWDGDLSQLFGGKSRPRFCSASAYSDGRSNRSAAASAPATTAAS